LPPWEDIKKRAVGVSADRNYRLLAVQNPYEGFNVTNDSALFNMTNIIYITKPIWKSGET